MREIRFRGWDPNREEFVHGGISQECGFTFIVNQYGRMLVDSESLGMATGMKDSLGNEIWEGDFCVYDPQGINDQGIIEYKEGQFTFTCSDGTSDQLSLVANSLVNKGPNGALVQEMEQKYGLNRFSELCGQVFHCLEKATYDFNNLAGRIRHLKKGKEELIEHLEDIIFDLNMWKRIAEQETEYIKRED